MRNFDSWKFRKGLRWKPLAGIYIQQHFVCFLSSLKWRSQHFSLYISYIWRLFLEWLRHLNLGGCNLPFWVKSLALLKNLPLWLYKPINFNLESFDDVLGFRSIPNFYLIFMYIYLWFQTLKIFLLSVSYNVNYFTFHFIFQVLVSPSFLKYNTLLINCGVFILSCFSFSSNKTVFVRHFKG